MQIVIDIDKEDYEKIKKTYFVENTKLMFNQSAEDRKNTMMLFRVIDAVKDGTPVVKGKWIEHEHEAGLNWEFSKYECSVCHAWSEDNSDYCPYCGADMQEVT